MHSRPFFLTIILGVASLSVSALTPVAVYNGGFNNTSSEIKLRIGNGGAGQSGLIGAWANAFIQHCVNDKQFPPFQVGWYLGDTTQSLGYLQAGDIDVAVTYNVAAENQSLSTGVAVQSVYGFRDHFYFVGPKSNPANLTDKDSILTMVNKIVTGGNADADTPPATRDATRFLSRFDKSATNIKESELFITIGQVPWALAYSKWYHQYPRFPLQALAAAASLAEYTLTDRGTWLSSPSNVTSALQLFKAGTDDATDPLLNPAHVLLGAKADPAQQQIWKEFMTWVVSSDGGQKVIKEFKKGSEVLYSEAPSSSFNQPWIILLASEESKSIMQELKNAQVAYHDTI